MRGEADAQNLTAAAVALLEAEIAPALSGELRFRTLMAVAALRMAEREKTLARALDESREGIYIASSTRDHLQLRKRIRNGDVSLRLWLHRALLMDAILRTAVTKPGALTAEEKKFAGVPALPGLTSASP
jgi:hypothetical protein